MSDEGIDCCSRTRERLDEKTLDLPKSSDFGYDLPISATEVGHRGTGVPTMGNSPDERAAHPYQEQRTTNQERDEVTVFHVNAQVSDDLEDVGGFRIEKLLRLLGFCWEAVKIRWKHGPMDWYYVPAPAK
jgi:hypothetical protein